MKKVLSLVLIVIMCLFTLTSCDMSDVKAWIGTNMPWVGTIIPGLTPDQPVQPEPDQPTTPATVAENARDYLESIYINFLDNNKTPADFELISSFKFNGATATVAWTTNNESITFVPKAGKEDTIVIATLPARGEADVEYVLTGTVTAADGSTATLSYTLVIPQMAINTYAEYAAAANGDLITVEGIVTGITKKSDGWSANNLFLQDTDGGYYVYNLADDQLNGVEVGMKVRVSGSKDNYNGTYEVVSASVSIVDSNKAPVTPADYTELLKNAEGLEAEALVGKQAFLVTIKGVTILEAGDNGYYYFQIGEHKVYLRISSSNNPCTSADTDAIKTAHAANFGNTGDVTGLVSIYSNKFYLTPVSGDAFNNFTVVDKTDAEKVAYEKENLSIKTSYSNAGEYTLPLVGANYTDVVVSWVSGSEIIVIGENGAITVTLPDENTNVTLTATFKLGDVTETKQYTVSVAAKPKVAFNIVDTPVVGNEYYFMVEQGNLDNKKLFALGEMDGNFMKTVEDYTTALKVKVLQAEGGYYLQIGEKYIGISSYTNSSNKTSYKITLDDAATTVFAWNTEHKTFTTQIGNVDLYIGAYNSFTTFSASNISYISQSFPAHLVTVGAAAVIDDGDYTISAGDIHLGALAEDKTYGYLPKADVGAAFTIKNVDGGITIQDSYGRYLYMSGSYNSFQLGNTAPEDGSHVWKVTVNSDGTYTFVNSVTEKIIGYSAGFNSAGAYAEAGTNVVALTLAAYVAPSDPDPDPDPTPDPDPDPTPDPDPDPTPDPDPDPTPDPDPDPTPDPDPDPDPDPKPDTPVISTKYEMSTIFTTTITNTTDVKSADGFVTFKLVSNSLAGNASGELRVYANKSGVIEFSKAITSLTINARGKGNDASNVTVYVSNDGVTYTEVSTVSFTTASDANFTLDGSYKYVKIAASGKQLQILSLTVVYE